jgi:hypothetical protein
MANVHEIAFHAGLHGQAVQDFADAVIGKPLAKVGHPQPGEVVALVI